MAATSYTSIRGQHGVGSWKLDFVQGFMQRADVYLGRGDQCPFGQWSTDGPGLRCPKADRVA